jgi:hypothetical protein
MALEAMVVEAVDSEMTWRFELWSRNFLALFKWLLVEHITLYLQRYSVGNTVDWSLSLLAAVVEAACTSSTIAADEDGCSESAVVTKILGNPTVC